MHLERNSVKAPINLKHHEDSPVFNLTLIELMRRDFDLDLSRYSDDLPKDESGIDVSKIFETVRGVVRNTPGFEVTEEIVLSTFSFSKYLMWKDLSDRTESLKK